MNKAEQFLIKEKFNSVVNEVEDLLKSNKVTDTYKLKNKVDDFYTALKAI